jgi:hypothetical protein
MHLYHYLLLVRHQYILSMHPPPPLSYMVCFMCQSSICLNVTIARYFHLTLPSKLPHPTPSYQNSISPSKPVYKIYLALAANLARIRGKQKRMHGVCREEFQCN